jgi:hypothetical protein
MGGSRVNAKLDLRPSEEDVETSRDFDLRRIVNIESVGCMVLLDPGSSPGVTRIGGVAEIAGPFDKLRVTATFAMT